MQAKRGTLLGERSNQCMLGEKAGERAAAAAARQGDDCTRGHQVGGPIDATIVVAAPLVEAAENCWPPVAATYKWCCNVAQAGKPTHLQLAGQATQASKQALPSSAEGQRSGLAGVLPE